MNLVLEIQLKKTSAARSRFPESFTQKLPGQRALLRGHHCALLCPRPAFPSTTDSGLAHGLL